MTEKLSDYVTKCFDIRTKARIPNIRQPVTLIIPIPNVHFFTFHPRFSDIKAAVEANENLNIDVMKRTTAVQTIVLQDVTSSTGQKTGFVIGNTHLYFRPDADHIRLIQIAVCLRQLEQVKL